MIGDLNKQIVFNPDTGEGTHYLFESHDKEVRLAEVYAALKEHHRSLMVEEKQMIRDMCLMIMDDEIDPKEYKSQLLRFVTGYLLGKYAVNTDIMISAENVRISGKEDDE